MNDHFQLSDEEEELLGPLQDKLLAGTASAEELARLLSILGPTVGRKYPRLEVLEAIRLN